MVNISRFFGKRKLPVQGDASLVKGDTVKPLTPEKQIAQPSSINSGKSGLSGSSIHQQKTLQIYGNAIKMFKTFHTALAQYPNTIDGCLLDIIETLRINIEADESALLALTEKITLDNELYSHAINTAIIAMTLGKGFSYSSALLQELGLSALLHHVGLFGMYQLGQYEQAITVGLKEAIQKREDVPLSLITTVQSEKQELIHFVTRLISQHIGSDAVISFPRSISDKQTMEYSHIIMLASQYEHLTHHKNIEERLIPHNVCKWLVEHWHKIHDNDPFVSQLIKVVIETIGLFPLGSYVYLSTDEIARIIKNEKESPVRPVVEVIINQKKERLAEQRVISLKDTPLIYIKEAIDETKLKLKDKKFLMALTIRHWWTE